MAAKSSRKASKSRTRRVRKYKTKKGIDRRIKSITAPTTKRRRRHKKSSAAAKLASKKARKRSLKRMTAKDRIVNKKRGKVLYKRRSAKRGKTVSVSKRGSRTKHKGWFSRPTLVQRIGSNVVKLAKRGGDLFSQKILRRPARRTLGQRIRGGISSGARRGWSGVRRGARSAWSGTRRGVGYASRKVRAGAGRSAAYWRNSPRLRKNVKRGGLVGAGAAGMYGASNYRVSRRDRNSY